ncbi:hypothetical protein [Actinomadura litoris]|uniref:Diacylglycerol O-acyltransferase n=1 Tax=Actinomadura litoris TaxID=2678616 RepID=A0A7K1KUJ4_9ACTN|nr:hypothetical protein [Actinomadura litoris]MUN35717.1 hypothetical protein [Actinomadura litoris]
MPGAPTYRLNPTDEMLFQAGERLGSSRIVQVLWRFPAEVSGSALRAEWDRLDLGLLSRKAVPARVPGARRRWVHAHNAEEPVTHPRPLADADVMDWIDAQARVPLPAGSDALWRLAAAPYRGGGLVSLTVPHFRSDGLGIFNALAAPPPGPAPRSSPAARLGGGDVGDVLGLAVRAAVESTRWSAGLLADGSARARVMSALRGGSPAPPCPAGGAEPRYFATTILAMDAGEWQERAHAHGGTVNSLFVEIAANLVRARVPLRGRSSIDIGIPMSLRGPDGDGRANALVVVPLSVPAGEPGHGDLTRTRRDTRTLLQGSGERSATLVPEPLWHLLPGRYADRLKAPGAQQTDAVASNFGRAPEGVARFAGQRADGVALRTVNVPGIVPGKARLRASLCLLDTGGQMIMTATGMPDRFGDAASLHRLVTDECARWGLRAEPWLGGVPTGGRAPREKEDRR